MTENTSLVRLGVFDQLKLILAQFTSSESKELDALEKVSTLEYRKISSLTNFFEESIRRMKDAGKNTNISANNYVSRYIGFDNTFFISDASWEILGEYNEDCISVPVKDIRRASYWAFINMPIIIY